MSARDEFRQRCAALVGRGATREAAVIEVARRDPDLHRRVLAEANPGKAAPAYWATHGVPFADKRPL